jgi:hypothetical protein
VGGCNCRKYEAFHWITVFCSRNNIASTEVAPEDRMSHISATVSLLVSKFFPSEAAFPLGMIISLLFDKANYHTDDIALLLEKLALENRQDLPPGWAPRTLSSGGVPHATIFDAFYNMYESQVTITSVLSCSNINFITFNRFPLLIPRTPFNFFHRTLRF